MRRTEQKPNAGKPSSDGVGPRALSALYAAESNTALLKPEPCISVPHAVRRYLSSPEQYFIPPITFENMV
jgi:hypothetical protein